MTSQHRRINLMVNVAIVILAIALGLILYKRFAHQASSPGKEANASQHPLLVGSTIPLNVDWMKKKQTLLIALDTNCSHCLDNGPFYQRLTAEASKTASQVVALLGAPPEESKRFLERAGITVDEIQQVSFGQIGIFAVPTLVSVDTAGVIRGLWVGKLSAADESELFRRLNEVDTSDLINPDDILVSVSELKSILTSKGKVTIVDVDEREAYAAGHIPSSRNIPLDELEVRGNQELDRTAQIIVYCRCATDGGSRLAAKVLYKSGFKNIVVLRGGLDAWRQREAPN